MYNLLGMIVSLQAGALRQWTHSETFQMTVPSSTASLTPPSH